MQEVNCNVFVFVQVNVTSCVWYWNMKEMEVTNNTSKRSEGKRLEYWNLEIDKSTKMTLPKEEQKRFMNHHIY